MQKLTLKGVGMVNPNVVTGVGRLGDFLEPHAGNMEKAVVEFMQ